MSVPPIGKELRTSSTENHVLFFLMLAAPILYIGARWLAPLTFGTYRAIEMLAVHCLFGRSLPIQLALAKLKKIDLIQDGGKMKR